MNNSRTQEKKYLHENIQNYKKKQQRPQKMLIQQHKKMSKTARQKQDRLTYHHLIDNLLAGKTPSNI